MAIFYHKRILMPTLLPLILLSSYLFGTENLHQHIYWQKLLHFKNQESQVDDSSFFLSKDGKTSAKAELEATLKALRDSNHNDINSTQCRYPARTRWLKNKLPKQEIKECQYLKKHLKNFDFKTLYLVYTSSFMNSPASMVGHTFLRFDKDEKSPLLSYALNYSAKIESNTNIGSYIYNGLFGGFEGRYNVIPYYEMVKLYSDMERRDIWEYKLNLTKEEIEKVLLHIFEIRNFYSDYFFASENCSYNLLWFIELAKEELKLVDKFDHITAPLDTIKELERQNMIESSTFRASKSTKIKDIYAQIEDKKIAKEFLNEANLTTIKELNSSQQIDILSLYFLKSEDDNIGDILKYRSTLGIKKSKKITPTTNPTKANRATKATISYNNQELEFGLRLAYHDIYDIDHDFNEGSYISFFDIKATTKKLNSLNLIKIDSIAKPHELYNPYSWGISFGFNREIEDKLRANLKLKGGKSFELFSALLFIEPTVEINYREKPKLSLGYNIGLLKSFKNTKLGLLSSKSHIEGFLTYQFLEDVALHLSVLERDDERSTGVGVFFYF